MVFFLIVVFILCYQCYIDKLFNIIFISDKHSHAKESVWTYYLEVLKFCYYLVNKYNVVNHVSFFCRKRSQMPVLVEINKLIKCRKWRAKISWYKSCVLKAQPVTRQLVSTAKQSNTLEKVVIYLWINNKLPFH